MALQGALMWICSLAVLSSCAAQDETSRCRYNSLTSKLKEAVELGDSLLLSWSPEERASLLLNLRNLKDKLSTLQLRVLSSCAAQDETSRCRYNSLTSKLKEAVECGDSLLLSWSPEEIADLLLNLRNLTDKLYTLQLRECQGAAPPQCPPAEVPEDGGLLCTTVSDKRYCKPMCNHGYDFSFLRRSRVHEECSKPTGFKWQSQFIGGNKLAVCIKAHIQVSGAASAYFSEAQDCLTTKSNSSLIESLMGGFMSELRSADVQGEAENSCLLCG
ncbi:hypothetical protein CesoFtcFv8_021399 [Champsocephalus esox]|uniref:Uncharacterized protein n=1 Tax=Champsocephalus esox TaxID=159716 RepID=A0AAN8BDS3_9TELE|nr:hypothetical protein CesoFtcFv8_021399 [Champsocephalus esox]